MCYKTIKRSEQPKIICFCYIGGQSLPDLHFGKMFRLMLLMLSFILVNPARSNVISFPSESSDGMMGKVL